MLIMQGEDKIIFFLYNYIVKETSVESSCIAWVAEHFLEKWCIVGLEQ